MTIVNVTIGALSLQLESNDSAKILKIAQKVNDSLEEVKRQHGHITDIKAVLILVLMLQDEIDKSNSISATTVNEEQEALKSSFYNLLDHLTDKLADITSSLKEES